MATYAPNQLHSVPLAEHQPDPMQPKDYSIRINLVEVEHDGSKPQNGF